MSGKILIVDDSLTVRMDLADAFEAAGLSCLTCASVREALDALHSQIIDLAILDVILPDGDGVDLLRDIRLRPGTRDLPILMLSSEAEVKDRIRGLTTGADEYVGKPYDVEYVVARGCELLGDRRRRPAGAAAEVTTILIIDDSATFREELRVGLESAGYEVLSAESGEKGLRLAASRRPTALVVDGLMPGMDGPTVIRRLRLDAALRRLPCLLLTASEEHDAELKALDAGADAFTRKDEDMTVILARLAAMLRAAGTDAENAASLTSPKRILAVDDSETYLHALAAELRDAGYEVVPVHSGEEAIELLAVQNVDCILLDLLMPGIGGRETCRRLKASAPLNQIPIIMLTAVEDRQTLIEGLATGADDYIAKSHEFDVLRARIQAQIRRKQFEDENRRIRDQLLKSELAAAEARAARTIAEAKAELVEELRAKNQELEAFSYSVSHDLRAPLRSIDGFSLALEEDYGDTLDETAKGYLQRVRAAAQRMALLIDDMLKLSRIGRADVHREQVDLSTLAHQVAADLQRQQPERVAQFHIESDMVAHADRGLMRVLFDNLLGNAWKFKAKAGEARIEFGAERREDDWVFAVRDNGAGFDMAHASQLFQPFRRLHGENEFPGTGIGLATVQRVVAHHGGRIWAHGEVDRGATIYFTLPPSRA